jgi:hypothetical protein
MTIKGVVGLEHGAKVLWFILIEIVLCEEDRLGAVRTSRWLLDRYVSSFKEGVRDVLELEIKDAADEEGRRLEEELEVERI